MLKESTYQTPCGTIHYWSSILSLDTTTLVFLPGLTADHRLFDKQVEHQRYIPLARRTCERGNNMAKTVHHGGKVGVAGKTLASNSSSKSAKSKAGKTGQGF